MNEMIKTQFDFAGSGIEDATVVAQLNALTQRGIALYTKTSIQMTAEVGQILSEAQDLLSSHAKEGFSASGQHSLLVCRNRRSIEF